MRLVNEGFLRPVTWLRWSARERATLARAADILDRARHLVGEETDEGIDLGKAWVVLDEYADGVRTDG